MNPKTATADDLDLGQRIAALRKVKGLTQIDLGRAVGVSFQQIQKYENGLNRVSGNRLQSLATALEVQVFALFGEAKAGGQNAAFALLAENGAVDLLRAYAAIESEQARRDVLALVRLAARIGAEASPKARSRRRAVGS